MIGFLFGLFVGCAAMVAALVLYKPADALIERARQWLRFGV